MNITNDKTLDTLCKSFDRQCTTEDDNLTTIKYQLDITSTFLESQNPSMFSYVDYISLESHFRTLEERYQRHIQQLKYSNLRNMMSSFMDWTLNNYARLAIAYYIDQHVLETRN